MPSPGDSRVPGVREQKATRAAFLVAGFLMAGWAPLVPLVQRNLSLEKKDLGLLLLCMGLGSILSMVFSGTWAARSGCRIVLLVASAVGAAGLVLASVAPVPALAAGGLLLFGAGVGGMDVVINVQAIRVEEASGKSLMSGFHGFFSLGGIFGAGGATLLLAASVPAVGVAAAIAAAAVLVTVFYSPGFLTEPEAAPGQIFALPRGVVVLIGLFCFVFFLAEGSVLDWSGVLLTSNGGLDEKYGGIGYVAFAIAMTFGRLTGDRVVERLGPPKALLYGASLAGAGFLFAALVSYWPAMIVGYAAIGLGAANTVPVCFTATGKQTAMPTHSAVAAVSTMGYTGILSGPAAIGFVAQFTSLSVGLALVGGCLLAVAAGSRAIFR